MSVSIPWLFSCSRLLVVSVGCCSLIAGTVALGQAPSDTAAPTTEKASAQVRLTPAQQEGLERIRHRIVEAGSIESQEVLEFRSPATGEATVLSVVPHGSSVKEGDVLLSLDDSALRQALRQQQIVVEKAAAAVRAAEAARNVAEDHADIHIPTAEQRVHVAKLARSRKLDKGGELSFQLAKLERQIAALREQLETQRPSAAADAQLNAVLEEKQLLEDHVRPHLSAALDLAIGEAQAQLLQAKRLAAARQAEAASQMKTADMTIKAELERLEQIRTQIEQCRIVAPRAGVVLHALSGGRRGAAASLEAGTKVQERQLLLQMPDIQRLRARIAVHESQISRIEPGQQVSLQCDALPNRKFAGRVAEVRDVPEAQSWVASDRVEYGVLVEILDPPDDLKIGMSVAAEFDAPLGESR